MAFKHDSTESVHTRTSDRIALSVLFAGIFLAFSGCAVNSAKEQQVYRDVLQIAGPEVSATEPLTLTQILRLANNNNENLAVEGEQFLRTLIARRRSASSFFPTVSLVPEYLLRDRVAEGSPPTDQELTNNVSSSGDQEQVNFDLSADITFTVFNGFRDLHRYWRDTYLIEQRKSELLEFQEGLLLDVARIYYQILRSEKSVNVLENSLSVQEERLRFTKGRFEAGLARFLDVAQTESQASVTRSALINAKRNVLTSREFAQLLCAAPVAERQLKDEYVLPAEVPPLEYFQTQARSNRRDLLRTAAAVDAAKHDVEIAFAQYYPTVNFNFSAYLTRESPPAEREWQGVLSANLPLFTAGRIRADVRSAWSFLREALFLQAYTTREVDQQVRTAFAEFEASRARLGELGVQLTSAEQSFSQAEALYRVGLATNLDRILAQESLLVAQLQLSSEQFDQKYFYLNLLRSAGILREEVVRLSNSG